jgi:hypothetical protein
VLAIGTELAAVEFLLDYKRRHQAACQEWETWDADKDREWDETFDSKHAELLERYAVSTLVEDVAFEIVPVGQN